MSTPIDPSVVNDGEAEKCQALREECARLQVELRSLQEEVDRKRRELLVVEEELMLETFALYRPTFALVGSAEYKERLEKIRDYQKALFRAGEAVRTHEQWKFKVSAAEGKALVKGVAKLMLRAFNNECDYCIDHVRFDNIENYEKRIRTSFETLNQLGKPLNAEIAVRYMELKLDELRLAYEYQCRKQQEREEQRAARARMREQEKTERELREAREKIEKERAHIVAATEQYKARLGEAATTEIRTDIEQKLAAAAERLAELELEAKQLAKWEASPRAGYVYVVSNIGSLGEGVYKIGVTRREHPEERIGELSDASVPFEFDTHAMIFSLDAYELESKLHAHFEHSRVNKVNAWKEFFRADIREIEAVIRENYDKGFDLVREPVAEEYRESLRL